MHDDATSATLVASRALLGIVARSLAPALSEVTVPQFRVLVVLSTAGPLRMGDLAERIGIHPSTLTRTVERLQHGGWITRAESPESRREVRVDLSESGAELVSTVTERRRALLHEVLDSVAPEDREAVRRGMEAFARAAGEPDARDLLELGI
ncbi:MarR family winged helix-turn-helix transcriptional regulator [Demequina phytophila]|uniref:MarR family winged helix-turn-helix transcriptional regulator n=1 Tax=Demequina phytophila TaxID=1638981 RepID=UPI0007803E8B|nr:MarR family transcriptional regulator [Demequina phytophila]